ncbi:hypothetical protein Tco_0133239 [Tanacetum coccineum]
MLSMTLNEYLEYEVEKERRSWQNFFAQPPHTPNTPIDKKDSGLDEILDDLFRIGAENLRQWGKIKFKMGVMLTHPGIRTMKTDVDFEKEKVQMEDDDDGNIYDIWDITVEDVKRIRQFLTPNIPDEMDEVIQLLIPQPIHTTPLNDDYVAPVTKSILDELFEEFSDEILNVTMVDEETNFNHIKDIEEPETLLAKDPQSHFTKIHVHSIITKPEPFVHTQPMSLLYGIFESYKSSTKPYKVDREMKSPSRRRRRMEEERINHLKQDQGLDELGEGSKEVVSKIGEFGGDIGSELLGDRGGEVLFGGGKGGEGGGL